MAGVRVRPSIHLASQIVMYGSLGTASSAVVYLLHDQIRQIHRMKRLFDGSGRRRISELARKHGICEATAQRFLDANQESLRRRVKLDSKKWTTSQEGSAAFLKTIPSDTSSCQPKTGTFPGALFKVGKDSRDWITMQNNRKTSRQQPYFASRPCVRPHSTRQSRLFSTKVPELSNSTMPSDSPYKQDTPESLLDFNSKPHTEETLHDAGESMLPTAGPSHSYQDETALHTITLESQVQELMDLWKSTRDMEKYENQLLNDMLAYDSNISKEMYLKNVIAASFHSREFDLAGRCGIIMLEQFQSIQSEWSKLIPTLTAVAAAGLVDTLKTILEALHESKLIPIKEEDRKAFLPIPLAIVSSRNPDTNIENVLEFLETTVYKYNLPIGSRAFERLISRVINDELYQKSLRTSARRILSLTSHTPDSQLAGLRQSTINSAFRSLVHRSPLQADLHYKRFKLICAFDSTLVTKDMCVLLIDSLTKSHLIAQDYVRKAGKTLQGFAWNVQRSMAFNKLRMDLAIHVVREISVTVAWLPKSSSEEYWNLESNFQKLKSSTSRKKEGESKIILARMRQAMGQEDYLTVDETFRSYISQQGGMIPSNRSLFCLAISANLKIGNTSAAMAIREQVAAQRGEDVIVADFMLEIHHILNNRTPLVSFDDYWPIIEKWHNYDQTENRAYFYDILVQVFKKIYLPVDLHEAAAVVREIYQHESHRSLVAKKKILKTLFVAYSKALDLNGVIWTISTAIEDGVEWDSDFQHLLKLHFKNFHNEFRTKADQSKAALDKADLVDHASAFPKLQERDRAVTMAQLVWATLTRLRKLTSKMHKRQQMILARNSQAVLNMLMHDLIKSETSVANLKEHQDVEMPKDFEEGIEDENCDSEANKTFDPGADESNESLFDTAKSKSGSLETDLTNPSRDENLHLLHQRKMAKRQLAFDEKREKQNDLVQREGRNEDTKPIPLMERITNYGRILGDENFLPPEILINSMVREIEETIQAIDKEFGPGPSPLDKSSSRINQDSIPPPMLERRPLPVKQRHISSSKSPWGSVSPIKVKFVVETSDLQDSQVLDTNHVK